MFHKCAAARLHSSMRSGFGMTFPNKAFFQLAGLTCSWTWRISIARSAGRMPTGQAVLQAIQSKQAYICSIRLGLSVQLALQAFACQRHPSARGGRLAQELAVRRADSQAGPAADAVQVLVFGGLAQDVKFSHSSYLLDRGPREARSRVATVPGLPSLSLHPISLTFTGRFSR